MDKKVALITGANSGIGLATAVELAKQGIYVVLMCRDKTRGEKALAYVLAQSGGEATLMLADLADLAGIKAFADEFKTKFTRLDILINNAGLITKERKFSKQGHELQFAVNHLGHFLLTKLLQPLLKDTSGSRIVVVSSMAHRYGYLDLTDLELEKGYKSMAAYGRSKLCNILFTIELAKQLKDTTTTVNCLHPGVVSTQLLGNIAGGTDGHKASPIKFLLNLIFLSPLKGAATTIYLATSSEVAAVSGLYFDKCKPKKTTGKQAGDEQLAADLWQVSEKLVESY
ncbi:MAG: SDR family oxidoreductase [Spirochaetaceae bacterium]|nr:SDR family oxidoreductase [Spirochaetaceae bacterium]